jgi:hypothetical protein
MVIPSAVTDCMVHGRGPLGTQDEYSLIVRNAPYHRCTLQLLVKDLLKHALAFPGSSIDINANVGSHFLFSYSGGTSCRVFIPFLEQEKLF